MNQAMTGSTYEDFNPTQGEPELQGCEATDFIEDENAGVHDPTEMADIEKDREFCECGSKLKISKAGNKYCADRCWIK